MGSQGGGARAAGVGRKYSQKIKTGKRPPDMQEDGGNPGVGQKLKCCWTGSR